MTADEKLFRLKVLLKITDIAQDAELSVLLDFVKDEILGWMYSGAIPTDVTDVPPQYESTQVMACVFAYGQSGADGQLTHSENGISRSWKHEDVVEYVRSRVAPFVRVV